MEGARRAGALIRKRFAEPRTISTKSRSIDLVTDADRAAEHLLLEHLLGAFPGSAVLGEESGFVAGTEGSAGSPVCWVIDPLDGTTNFAHGVPHFAVSVAATRGLVEERSGAPLRSPDGRLLAGAVYDPMRDEMFSAVADGPALLNDAPTSVTETDDLEHALLATGFPYDRREHADRYLADFREMMLRARDVRRMGAAALDLAWVACGRIDGFWEWKLHPWDVAAGILIVRRAGGRVTSFSGSDPGLDATQTLASNGRIHATMVAALSAAAS